VFLCILNGWAAPRAGLKSMGAGDNFHWRAPMTYFMTSSFVKYVFVDSPRSRLLYAVVECACRINSIVSRLWS